jgi:hypothetical protein
VRSRVSIAELIRGHYAAYETKNREAIEALLTADFTFSSPLDERIRRVAYFRRCWPNCQKIREVQVYFGSRVGTVGVDE